MQREFFLWAGAVLHMSATVMNRLRIVLGDRIGRFNEEEYEKILKEKILDKHCQKRFEKFPYNNEDIYEKKVIMKKMGISYITIEDEEYPDCLKNIYDPPYILYYIGDINLLKNRAILGVVGSRKATDYGKNATEKIVREVAGSGIIIISGMARGIDSYAHINCMKSDTPTIAVMGTSIDKVYPASSTNLKKEIIKSGGLVLSEYFIGAKTEPVCFAMRNRIISGLSSGVLVVEAKEKSGALITMDCALQQGRNVYSVPGSIFSENSRGCNMIISQGAKPVQNPHDILEDFNDYIKSEKVQNKNNNKKISKNSGKTSNSCVNIRFDNVDWENISEEEVFIIKILRSKGVVDIDELSILTNYDIADLIYYINKLLLKGLIMEEGSNRYTPNII